MSSNGDAANVREQSVQRLIVLGYITAVAIPPVGVIVGIVLAARHSGAETRHAVRIIVISIVAFAVWLLILSSGVVDTTNNDLS